jgi:hypothetical protein
VHFTPMRFGAAQDRVEQLDVAHGELVVEHDAGGALEVFADVAEVEPMFQAAIGDGSEHGVHLGGIERGFFVFDTRTRRGTRCPSREFDLGGGIKGTRAGGGLNWRGQKIFSRAASPWALAIAAGAGTGGTPMTSAGNPRHPAAQAGGSTALGRAGGTSLSRQLHSGTPFLSRN